MKKNDGKSKQVILIRKDLNMSPGKLGAQVAHASVAALLDFSYVEEYNNIIIPFDNPLKQWLEDRFTKICLAVDNLEMLQKYYQEANKAGLRTSIIKDAGFTEFDKPTYTCVAIGPNLNEDINKITGKLKLYK